MLYAARSHWVLLSLAALVAACGGGSSPTGQDDAGQTTCNDDSDCPTGQTCNQHVCVTTGPGDGAVDTATPQKMLVSPTLLDFGSPYLGGEYAKSFTIANVGGSPLTIATLNLIEDRTTGAFSLNPSQTPLTVAPGATLTVDVVLRPNDENLPTGSVKIHSDDPDSATADATVDLVSRAKGSPRLGVCAASPSPPPACVVSNDGNPVIDFGTLDYGTAAERVVALTNVGDGNLPIDVTEISLTDPTFFALTFFEAVDDPAHPGQKLEQAATLPFFLGIGDSTVTPPVAPTELRVHVRFAAVGVDGDVPHESLVVKYSLPESPTSVPIVGKINGCKPADTDGGVPDGGADPQTDPNNCGTCGHTCVTAHGTPACAGGVCQTATCDPNWGDCDDDPANGCETDLRVTAAHCGTCAVGCTNPHGPTLCQAGVCTPSCDNGYDDCDGTVANGCETRTATDPNHCGTCDTVCTNAHGTTVCVWGVCTPTCVPGFESCDGDPRNGCETNTNVDIDNCGHCGTKCTNPSGSISCVGGVCQPGCDQGYADCDGNTGNGCESNIMTDADHCGSCTIKCVNPHGLAQCLGGACSPSCLGSYGDCDGNTQNGCEASLLTDINNCGGCLRPCTNSMGSGSGCASGACTAPQCVNGWGNCDGDNWNGCEQQLNTLDHCGVCANRCTNANGTTACNGTACVPSCAVGYGDCNGNPSDGCETDLATVTYCGTCTLDAQCPGTFFCNGAQCEKKRVRGATCAAAKECALGFCVEGTCCESACTAACKTCANPTGTCANIAAGQTDAFPANACTGSFACDGNGNCRLDRGQACGQGSDCALGHCVDNTCCQDACTTPCKTCANPTGTCTTNVPPLGKDTNSSPPCTGTGACDGNGSCLADNGQACANAAACASGFCVDGTCCESSCMATCRSCANSTGTCAYVGAGLPDTNASTACSGTKACDGNGTCKNDRGQACAASTDCALGFCVDGTCCESTCTDPCRSCANPTGSCQFVPAGSTDTYPANACTGTQTCDGAGHCLLASGQACSLDSQCALGHCVDGTCCQDTCTAACKSCANAFGTCTTNVPKYSPDAPGCTGTSTCDGSGTCLAANGQTCAAGTECASGLCIDGVCCDSACSDPCMGCNVSGHVGTCWNLPQFAVDLSPPNACVAPNSCDGSGHCRSSGGQTCSAGGECATGFCVDGVCCDSACTAPCKACNVAPNVGTCSNLWQYANDNNPVNACTGTSTCDGNGSCKKANGQTCAVGTECASGGCVDGVCCDTACSSPCKSCAVTGHLGTCWNLPQYAVDANPANACVAPNNCDGSGNCKKANGQTCATGTDCASGNCIDGVCCDTACNATCTACNVSGHVGTCWNIPQYGPDTYPANTCVAPTACDGNGNCRLANGQACAVGTDCASGNCVDGVCCNSGCTAVCQACNVAGNVGTCANLPQYTPDAYPLNACVAPNTCDGSGNCRSGNGQACTAGTDCASGNCVDGVCCNSTCTTTCLACSVAGHVGTCWNLPQFSPDTNPANACVGNSACDGAGHCRSNTGQACTAGTDCASGNCVDGVCCDTTCLGTCLACNVAGHVGTCSYLPQYAPDTYPANECGTPSSCDGAGHCRANNGQSCSTGTDCASGNCVDGVCCASTCTAACMACNVTGSLGTCANLPQWSTDSYPANACTGGSACDGAGTCKKVNGQTCTAAGDCVSANCVDGYCCDTTCTTACTTCALAGSLGTCSNLPLYASDTNPANACVAPATCDGAGHCRQANGQTCAAGADCASGNCVDGVCCDTACTAACVACNVGGHVGTCWNLPQYSPDTNPANTCVAPSACDGAGHCRKANGQTCSVGADCASGSCVDGYCCDSTCTTTCMACNVAGSLGSCTNLPRYTPDTNPTNACVAPNSCDGAGHCRENNGQTCAAGTDCASGYCVDGVCCDAACTGTCVACNVAGSVGMCTNLPLYSPDTFPANTCVAPNACDGAGHCRKANGQTCTAGADCAAGNCVDGVCCDTACTGTCMACTVAGHVGTCSNLPLYSPDAFPANTCVAPNSCDGAGHCRKNNGQTCSTASDCASSNCVDGVCCDTACTGTCTACNVAGHVGTCSNLPPYSPDTFPANTCAAPSSCDGNGHCRKNNGQTCTAGADCASGNCVDGVCCDTTCTTPCLACNVTGHVGTCSNVPSGQTDTNPANACVGNYACDGAGHCDKRDGQTCVDGAECLTGNCVDGYCCDTACTGTCKSCAIAGSLGTCANLPAWSPDNYPAGTCVSPSSCDGGGGCKKNNGQACSLGSECVSTNCVDGVCCNSGCTTTCYSCAVSGSVGTCTLVPNGQQDGYPANACTGSNACDGAGTCRALGGQTCSLPSECLSGNCVDGYCCDTACTDTCKGCNVLGSVGTCTNLPVWSPDNFPTDTCVGNFACDGSGHCEKQNGQTCTAGGECVSTNCVDGYCCDTACTGTCKSCAVAGNLGTCTNLAAWVPDNYPANTCVAPSSCDGSGHCKKNNGQTCAAGGECVSTNCVDGYCCDTACGATCKACSVGGSLGTCTNLPSGQADNFPTNACVGNYACDGSGNCEKRNGQTCTAGGECVSTNCVDGVCCDSACAGTCTACNVSGSVGTCANLPSGQTDTYPANACVAPYACDGGGACKKVLGTACAGSGECLSNNCADGVCCNSVCTGTCLACNLAGNVGTCTNIPAWSTDNNPAGTCVSPNACDGSGICKKTNGVACGANGECLSNNCVDGVCCSSACTTACYSCSLTGSVGTCTAIPAGQTDTNPTNACVAPNACDGGGNCKKTLGQTCSVNGDCLSTNCVDSVCCNSVCNGTCVACNLTGSVGTCTNIPYGGHDTNPANTCVDPRSCNGAGACLKNNGQSCSAGGECLSNNCVDGVCCNSDCTATCQGCAVAGSVGTCAFLPSGQQDNYPTNACVGNFACDGSGNCEKQNGQACVSGSECVSGNCVDGVCCNTGCTPTCYACNLSGAVGTCTAIAFGQQDTYPANACTGQNACNGSGACKELDGQTCSSSSDCLHGHCVDGVCCDTDCTTTCKACNVASHVGTCWNVPWGTADTYPTGACSGAYACDGALGCKKVLGQSCSVNGDCLSGACCGSTCVDLAANNSHCGGCGQACTNANATGSYCSGGTCTAPACNADYHNLDGNNYNGCECHADGVANACMSALDLGAIVTDGSGIVVNTSNITPDNDEDWYRVTFVATSGSCGWNPRIWLTGNANVKMNVYTDCSSATISCAGGEGYTSGAQLTEWRVTYAGTCGAWQNADPYRANFATLTQPVYVHVYSIASDSTCHPYTLNITN
jgi:hypothetical protein